MTSIRHKICSARREGNPTQSNAVDQSQSAHGHLDGQIGALQIGRGSRHLQGAASGVEVVAVEEDPDDRVLVRGEGALDVGIDNCATFTLSGASLKTIDFKKADLELRVGTDPETGLDASPDRSSVLELELDLVGGEGEGPEGEVMGADLAEGKALDS